MKNNFYILLIIIFTCSQKTYSRGIIHINKDYERCMIQKNDRSNLSLNQNNQRSHLMTSMPINANQEKVIESSGLFISRTNLYPSVLELILGAEILFALLVFIKLASNYMKSNKPILSNQDFSCLNYR